MAHIEGYDGLEEGEFEEFIKKMTEIFRTKGTSSRGGGGSRYALSIGRRNRFGAFEPQVATKEGTKTLYIWNLLTDDLKTLEQKAVEIGLPVDKCPLLWQTTPASFPGQISVELLPAARKDVEKEKKEK